MSASNSTRIRVPMSELRPVASALQRVGPDLLGLTTKLSRALEHAGAAGGRRGEIEQLIARAIEQARTLSAQSDSLARSLRIVLDGFAETDRRGAAAVPLLPRPDFPASLVAAPGNNWPFSPMPQSPRNQVEVEPSQQAPENNDQPTRPTFE